VARRVVKVARAMFQRWEERRFEGGKSDVVKVARAMFQRWEERCSEGGKTDGTRYQLRRGCYGSDTLGCGKNDVQQVARAMT
jgi:hypothetical protein